MSKNLEEKKSSSSPDRYTFQATSSKAKLAEAPDNADAAALVAMYESWKTADALNLVDPVWQKDNLEYDLRSTEWILDKVRASTGYSQNLYAAMCNRDFQKLDVMPILKDQRWSCSWRHAGGIIADMREAGDYIDWYCSGIQNHDCMEDEQFRAMTKAQQEFYLQTKEYVGEGCVTDEIRADLQTLGWVALDED